MKWCVSFPEENVLIVRPSLKAICYQIGPAAKLLAALLYRYSIRQEHQAEAENINDLRGNNDQDTTCKIYRRQSQLVEDMCGEITEKTLHDVAVPTLQVLGYLDVEEHMACNCYILNIPAIEVAMDIYKKHPECLDKFLADNMPLEKFLIDKNFFLSAQKDENGLEIFLIDKKKFQSGLEKFLIQIRKSSNCRRGRKGSLEAGSRHQKKSPKSNIRDSRDSNSESEYRTSSSHSQDEHTHTESQEEKGNENLSDAQCQGDQTRNNTQEGIDGHARASKDLPASSGCDSLRTDRNLQSAAGHQVRTETPQRAGDQARNTQGNVNGHGNHRMDTGAGREPVRRGVVARTPHPQRSHVQTEERYSPEAQAIRKMYDEVALGPGKKSGHPQWDWKAMEEMAQVGVSEDEIRLVYNHLKGTGKKYTVQAVWENWTVLATLKKPSRTTKPPVSDEEKQASLARAQAALASLQAQSAQLAAGGIR